MSSDFHFQFPHNDVMTIPYPFSYWCQVNGVPSPQSLGHILSEDEELNEISDELPQVFLVLKILALIL